MFEETLARLRTHHKNVQRYRQLLETSLTDFEREYIGKGLFEEQAAIEELSSVSTRDLADIRSDQRRTGAITLE